MKEGKAKFENKGLVILLCVLVVAIVGLVVGIGAVMLNSDNEEVVVETDSTGVEYAASTATPEQIEAYESFKQKYDVVLAEAQELLNESPVNVLAIEELFANAMDEYMTAGTYSSAQEFMVAEYNILMSGGFKQEALDSLIRIDFDIFPASVQNRWYNLIVNLAQDLGNNDLAVKYRQLADWTKESAEQNEAAIREHAAKYDVDAEFMQGGI